MKNLEVRGTTSIMPLLMACTKPSQIETAEPEMPIIYDPISQKVDMDLRIVGTKSLRQYNSGKLKPGMGSTNTDKKNEIDDQKTVK